MLSHIKPKNVEKEYYLFGYRLIKKFNPARLKLMQGLQV